MASERIDPSKLLEFKRNRNKRKLERLLVDNFIGVRCTLKSLTKCETITSKFLNLSKDGCLLNLKREDWDAFEKDDLGQYILELSFSEDSCIRIPVDVLRVELATLSVHLGCKFATGNPSLIVLHAFVDFLTIYSQQSEDHVRYHKLLIG